MKGLNDVGHNIFSLGLGIVFNVVGDPVIETMKLIVKVARRVKHLVRP